MKNKGFYTYDFQDGVIVKSKEKVVMIGSFLNYYDKKRLMKKIEDALQNYKISYRV